MSLFRLTAPLASLFFFSAFAVAQIQVSAPSCTVASWQWTFNSLDQSPCTVAAYMTATCDAVDGAYSLGPLPSGYSYYGPDSSDDYDLCYCNTVGYSLFSACDACQGQEWITWSEWVTNCTKILPPSSYPNAVPSGVRVPQWALLDVTNETTWDANKSYATGDFPELGPGAILGPSGVSYSVTPTSSFGPSSTGSRAPPSGSSNTAAVVGGVVGGIAAVCIAVAAIFYRRRRSQAPSSVSAGVGASQPQQPLSNEVAPSSLSGSPTTMKLYDPSDPTTFPGYKGGTHSQDIHSQTNMSSFIGSGSTLAHTETSPPLARGYHGHPTV